MKGPLKEYILDEINSTQFVNASLICPSKLKRKINDLILGNNNSHYYSESIWKEFSTYVWEKGFFKLIIMTYKKEKILFYAPVFEYPTSDGPSISVLNAIKVLSRTSNLYIFSNKEKSSPNFLSTKKFYSSICKIFFLYQHLSKK